MYLLSFRPKAQRPPVPLLLEMAVLISLSITGGISLFFKLSSLLCMKFLCTAGSNSQLVSNTYGDILLCLCENSLCFSKAEEADGMQPNLK